LLSREENTVVDDYGRGWTMKGAPSTPGPESLSLELRLSADHKEGIGQRRAVISREDQRVVKRIWVVMGKEGAQISSWTSDPYP
jgi:hypothetical protein